MSDDRPPTSEEIRLTAGMPTEIANGFIAARRAEDPERYYDELRTLADTVGMNALDNVIAKGVPADVAGQRIAEFNDKLIDAMRKQHHQ